MASAIADFNLQMAWETEAKTLERDVVLAGVRRLLADPTFGFYLVALDQERVVAQLMVTYEWSDWRNGMFWWIQSVYVDPAYRRLGLFRRLYEDVLRRTSSAQERVVGIRLYVERDNAVAKSTYERLGMSQTSYALFELGLGPDRLAHVS